MVETFKNFERLRYRMSCDIKEIVCDTRNNTVEMKNKISTTVFSTVFAAFINKIAFESTANYTKVTEVCNEINTTNYDFIRKLIGETDICNITKRVLFFIMVYIIAYYAYILINKLTEKCKEIVKIHHDKKKENKMLQKDFDNIACDSLLAAKGYQKAFEELEDTPENRTLKEFYCYEILHYLHSACDKTSDLLMQKEKYIRNMDNGLGVDNFRICNVLEIMEELSSFLKREFDKIPLDYKYRQSILYQYNLVKEKLGKMKKRI